MEKILYEDADVAVCYKPPGMPSQTSRFGQKDVVSILKNHRAAKREPPYIALINRLDQPVEGLLLAAKSKSAAALLSQPAACALDKCYRAVVRNRKANPLVAGDTGTLSDYLKKDGRTNTSKVVEAGTKGAKEARLTYRVLRAREDLAELYIRLDTGRHHQIRVQMANASLPLVGDCKYGQELKALGSGFWIALCSVKISFIHPITRKKMEFEIEPENPAFQLLYR